MADLTVAASDLDGLDLDATLAAAAAAGDSFNNDGKTIFIVKNANVSTDRTVTIDSVTNCNQGFDHNGGGTATQNKITIFGPFPINRFNDVNGKVQVTYDTEVDLTVAAVQVV